MNAPKHDREVVSKISSIEEKKQILIFVKSWEPPTAETLDFFKTVRSVLDEGVEISILPISHNAKGINEMHLHAWSMALAKVSDPWLRLYQYDFEAGGLL